MRKLLPILLMVSIFLLTSCNEAQNTDDKCPLARKKECNVKKECGKTKTRDKSKTCDKKKACDKAKKGCEIKKKCCPRKYSAKKDVYPGWNLGIQAWTFHTELTLFETIDKTAELGLGWLEAYPGQSICAKDPDVKFDHTSSAELRKKVKCKLKKAGVTLAAYGVVMQVEDEPAKWRQIFEFAKDMNIKIIAVEPGEEATLDIVYKLCKEFGIKAAIHNHPSQRSWSMYSDPDKVLRIAKKYDGVIGACADVGHWARSGYDAVESLKKLEGHITYVHIKDVAEAGTFSDDVPFGKGEVNIKAVLAELDRQGFKGPISIEYPKKDWKQSDKDMTDSITYFNKTAKKLK